MNVFTINPEDFMIYGLAIAKIAAVSGLPAEQIHKDFERWYLSTRQRNRGRAYQECLDLALDGKALPWQEDDYAI